MSVRPRRWIAALLLLVFTIGTTQAASALPHACGGAPALEAVAMDAMVHADHADMAEAGPADDDKDCTDCAQGMSAKACAAFCLIAVPVPALIRLAAPAAPDLPEPMLDTPGQGWSPPGDARPPRTTSIG